MYIVPVTILSSFNDVEVIYTCVSVIATQFVIRSVN